MMTATQLTFFRALCAPFAPHETSTKPGGGGKKLTWIDKRALENRLDDVAGPPNWFPEYESTSRGYKCRLSIRVPLDDGTWGWIAKEDGAGFEEMGATNKQTGEFECDVDNDEKSGYTNALRRAAQDAWGIGRDLYQKGVPKYMTEGSPESAPRSSAPPAAPRTQETGRGNGDQRFDNFKIPKAGRAVFAWAKGLESTFQTSLLNGLVAKCQAITGSKQLDEMNQDQANEACMDVIAFIKTLDNYGGQFDNLVAPKDSLPDFGPGPVPPGPPPAKDLYRLKKQVLDLSQKLIFILTGAGGTPEEIASEVQVYSKAALGREIGSLKACVSEADLSGLVDYIGMRIVRAQEDASDARLTAALTPDDIPF